MTHRPDVNIAEQFAHLQTLLGNLKLRVLSAQPAEVILGELGAMTICLQALAMKVQTTHGSKTAADHSDRPEIASRDAAISAGAIYERRAQEVTQRRNEGPAPTPADGGQQHETAAATYSRRATQANS